MKRAPSVLPLLFVLGCTQSMQELPTIVVDEAHSGLGRTDNSDPKKYSIQAPRGIVVEPGAYTFPFRTDFNVAGPNSIHILAGADRKYRMRWRGPPDRAVANSDTLEALPGSKPFQGFRSGDTVIVAIGYDGSHDTPSQAVKLSAMWMGLVEVQ
jgi:hypothetical protein